MSNIIDYIKWRGDVSLKDSGFNEVDNLVLSRFSYFPLDTILKEKEEISIKKLSERFRKIDINKVRILWPDDVNLFPLMGESQRYGEMIATKFVNIFDAEQEKQFAAVTILMPDDTLFISYRGTDSTIVGWKEDFNMSFKSHIASQISAKKYLEEVANQYPDRKIRIGGHSKGGNIAIYAATFANKKIKKRIIKVYNNDGPGFCEDVIESDEYKEILNRVHTYIPQESIIGRLMYHEENFTIVESTGKGIMQHDLYTWQVLGAKFVNFDEFTKNSEFIDKTITGWLQNVEPAKREQAVDVIFDILFETDAKSFKEIKANLLENSKIMAKSYRSLDKETRGMVTKTLTEFLRVAKDNAFKKK